MIDDYRFEALQLAVELHTGRDTAFPAEDVLDAADRFTRWLHARPARLILAVAPTTFEQGDPARHHPTKRTGDPMSVTMTDDQEVSYSVQAEDDKGAPVSDTLTWSADDNGAVVTVTPAADGMSCVYAAVAPGTATVSVTDGTLSASDLITVTAGAAASLVLTPGTPAAEGASTPAAPASGADAGGGATTATPGTSN
ncbi:MAG TPA: hypothetical protein VHZ03_36945 [Trebonia sp.]|nr:hypothetical protein [Trebonia sp.]